MTDEKPEEYADHREPCPFCGGTDIDFYGDDVDLQMQCQGCLATGPVATIGCRDPEEDIIDLEEEARLLWNERARPNLQAVAVEQEVEDTA